MSGSKSIERFRNMFDRVRVRTTSVTEAAGLAGCTGQIYGETVPSTSGVGPGEIMGELKDDYAVNVHFKELNKSVWFTRDLLEFVDHAPGTEVNIGGRKRVRTETGEWIETPAPQRTLNAKSDNRKVKIIVGIVTAVLIIIILAVIKRL